MTRKQSLCLAFIAKFCEQNNGTSPSLAEIAIGIGTTSKGSISRYLDILENDGLIRRTKHRARSIQIIDPGEVKLNPAVFELLKKYAGAERMSVDGAVNQIVRDVLERAA